MAVHERQAAVVEGYPRTAPPASSLPWRQASFAVLGLPVHRLHEAGGEALTTAQLFMALASHLDQVHPQSVESIARLCSKDGDCNRGASR